MKITRTSILSGKVHTLDLPITRKQLFAYKCGVVVQDAFPQLSSAEREFIYTGITAEEWDMTACFGYFKRKKGGIYVGGVDLSVLGIDEYDEHIFCRLISDYEDPIDLKLVCDI